MASSQQNIQSPEPTKGSTQDGEKQRNGAPGKAGGILRERERGGGGEDARPGKRMGIKALAASTDEREK